MRLLLNILPGNASLLGTKCAEDHSMGASLCLPRKFIQKNFVWIVCKPCVCLCLLAMCFSNSSTPTCVCPHDARDSLFPPAQCLAILLSVCFFTDDRQRLKAENCFCPDSEIQRGMSEKVKLEQEA